LDNQLFDKINAGFPMDGLTPLASFLSANSTWWAAAFLWLLMGLLFRKSLWVKAVVVGALALGTSDALCTYVLKPSIQRPRPCHQKEVKLRKGSCGSLHGMPSNHASNGAAVVAVTCFFLPRLVTLGMAFAVFLVGWSRIYLGVHYPLDVLAGFLLGSLLGGMIGFSFIKTTTYLKKISKNNVPH